MAAKDANWSKPLGAIPSGLFILTLRHAEKETGLLLSWVQQCGFEPPQVSLALRHDRFQASWLADGAAATLHPLGEDDQALLKHFAKGFSEAEPAFDGLTVRHRKGHAPILEAALGFLDLKAMHRHRVGDHDLFVCRILDGDMLRAGKPWVHLRRTGMTY